MPFLTSLAQSAVSRLRVRRFDAATGRPRRRVAVVAAAVALTLFAGSGVAIAAATSAQAHTPAINSDCTQVKVDAWDYSSDVVNTVDVTIYGGNPDGSDRVEHRTFGTEFHESFVFLDSSVGWSYKATITAPDDDGTKGWTYSWSDTTKGCAQPDIGVTATQCSAPGELSTVNAVISPLEPTHSYTVRLTGSNGYDSGAAPIQTTTASWSGLTPDVDYTAELVDTTSGLSDKDTVHAIGCPQDQSLSITVAQCTVPGGSGTLGVNVADLVAGRNYSLALVNVGGPTTTIPFTASSATYTTSFSTSPSGSYYVTITDTASGTSKQSNTASFLPCPATPQQPVLDPTQCDTVTGASNAAIAASIDGLVPGRSYEITLVTGTTTFYSEALPATTASTWAKKFDNLQPGTYTLTVTDVTDPAAAGFSASATVVLDDCPTQPDVAVTATQCTVIGGAGELSAEVTNLAVGRTYTVTLTQNGAPVAGQPASETFTPTDASPVVFSYDNLAPGQNYRVLVKDDALPTIIAAADVTLTECPGNPDVKLTSSCTFFTTSTLTVDLSKLVTGEDYTVTVTKTADGSALDGVPAQQVSGSSATASLKFTDVPVNNEYTVSIVSANHTLASSSTIYLTLCDVQLPTLAYTGASTMTPTLAGLGFLQFGLVLVGIGLVRRRSGARKA